MSTLSAILVQGLAEYVSLPGLEGFLSEVQYRVRTADSATFARVGIGLVLLMLYTMSRTRVR